MDLARLLGEAVTDEIAVLLDLVAKFAKQLPRRRCCRVGRDFPRPPRGHARRHRRLFDLPATAIGTGDLPLLGLPGSEEHTSELQSLMRISYAVFSLKKQNDFNYTLLHPITNLYPYYNN